MQISRGAFIRHLAGKVNTSKFEMSRGRSVHYKSLNNFSSASEHEILAQQKARKRKRDVYNVEEILAEKKVSVYAFILN